MRRCFLIIYVAISFLFFVGLYVLNFTPNLILARFIVTSFLVLVRSKVMLRDNSYFSITENKNYECRFEYGIRRSRFSLQFYIIRLSFLLFDLEICLFTPLIGGILIRSLSLKIRIFFLLLVLRMLRYEYRVGAFNW